MESFESNKTVWSNIYKAGLNNLSYPNENLVRYLYYLYPEKNFSDLKVLDYGFGSGNNLRHLDLLNCDVYGVEISEHAKNLTVEKLRKDFDTDKLFIMNSDSVLPYEKESFDVVISWQVLYYNSLESLEKVLAIIKGLLKPGGKFIGTMARMEDIAFANSVQQNEYEWTTVKGNQTGSVILGMHTEEDIKKIFGMFTKIDIGYFETKLLDIVGSHWVIYGEKND